MDLVRLMLCSQTSFVEKRIRDEKYSKAFKDTMLSFIKLSSVHNNLDENLNVALFASEVELMRLNIEKDKPNYVTSLFNEEYNYRMMAADLTQDVVNSVLSRFITGGTKTYLEFFEVKAELC
jgi:hypothetical protein